MSTLFVLGTGLPVLFCIYQYVWFVEPSLYSFPLHVTFMYCVTFICCGPAVAIMLKWWENYTISQLSFVFVFVCFFRLSKLYKKNAGCWIV